MEFLMHGAVRYGEPGVCMDFEETEKKLAANVASLGFDLRELAKRKKLLVDHVSVERNQIAETGEYNLDGLFIRLDYAVKAIKAKRVVLDSIEALFSGLTDSTILRAELRRLFRWLEDHKLTAVVTGEAGEHTLTRHGLEEYGADCVIALDHRVTEQISTRRLRIVKYRGTSHGTLSTGRVFTCGLISSPARHCTVADGLPFCIRPLARLHALGAFAFHARALRQLESQPKTFSGHGKQEP
jgi:circadian clock protein KaiC